MSRSGDEFPAGRNADGVAEIAGAEIGVEGAARDVEPHNRVRGFETAEIVLAAGVELGGGLHGFAAPLFWDEFQGQLRAGLIVGHTKFEPVEGELPLLKKFHDLVLIVDDLRRAIRRFGSLLFEPGARVLELLNQQLFCTLRVVAKEFIADDEIALEFGLFGQGTAV